MKRSESLEQQPTLQAIAAAACTGAVAMGLAGAANALYSLASAAQFVRGGAKLIFVGYSTLLHAFSGLIIAAIVASTAIVLYHGTGFGALVAYVLREHEARRDSSPETALRITATILSVAPAFLLSLLAVHTVLLPFVSGRQVVGLVVLVTMAGTVAGFAIAVPVAFLLGKAIELLARPGLRSARGARALTWFWSPFLVTVGLLACVLGGWLAGHWDAVVVRAIRGPSLVLLGAVAFAVPGWRIGRWLVTYAFACASWLRWTLALSIPLVLLLGVLATGHDLAAIKATTAHTEIGGRLTRAVRRIFDWDRDGYARLLGGGDCDDSDASVHPGALDRPGDHVDANCLGGDAVELPPNDHAFAEIAHLRSSGMNILLITIDTLRFDHLGLAGYQRPTSPNIDKLAARSVVFENGWSNAPSTYSAMPALLTGRMPLDLHTGPMLDGAPTIASRATTLGEALRDVGYVTGAVTNLPYFEPTRGLNQGFASYDNANAMLHSRAGKGDARGSSAPQQTVKALEFVDRTGPQRWFLWVHYFDPHYRYERHADVPDWGPKDVDVYDGEVRFTDTSIGELISGLASRQALNNTVIILTSDHGESFGEHGLSFHGNHLYAVQTRVPFIVSVPGLPPRRVTTPIGHTDLYATIVNLAGGSPTPDMMGRSMVDVLSGSDHDGVVFQELSAKSALNLRGAASSTCHVIYSSAPNTAWEVYRIDRDPLETTDLADTSECSSVRAALAFRYNAK